MTKIPTTNKNCHIHTLHTTLHYTTHTHTHTRTHTHYTTLHTHTQHYTHNTTHTLHTHTTLYTQHYTHTTLHYTHTLLTHIHMRVALQTHTYYTVSTIILFCCFSNSNCQDRKQSTIIKIYCETLLSQNNRIHIEGCI